MESHTVAAQPMCSEALTNLKKSLFNRLCLPSTLTGEAEEVKRMHRNAALIGDKDLSLVFWTLSSFVARVDEPANQTHWDLAGWLPNPMFFFRKAFLLDQIQIARLACYAHCCSHTHRD
jgi:hypothetical protein